MFVGLGSGAGRALPQGLAVGLDRAVALSFGPSSTSWQASPARAGGKILACAVATPTVCVASTTGMVPRLLNRSAGSAHLGSGGAFICTRRLRLQRLRSKLSTTSIWLMPSTCFFCRAVGACAMGVFVQVCVCSTGQFVHSVCVCGVYCVCAHAHNNSARACVCGVCGSLALFTFEKVGHLWCWHWGCLISCVYVCVCARP